VSEPDDSLEILIRMTADTSGGKEATESLKQLGKETKSEGEATEESGRHAERSGLSHRALHMVLRQVGESSKGLEIGLAALSGVMMGSVTFGITAVIQGVRLLIGHFQQLKEKALEAAKETVRFWESALQANSDARKAASDYVDALRKIIENVDTLKQKEAEEQTVLQKVLEARLKILEAERQAEITKAFGDKEEEARINARYGQQKSDVELQNEQAEIDLKKGHLDEQTRGAMEKQRALQTAEKTKEAGAPGRTEAGEAEGALPKLGEELAKLQAERMKPGELAALRQKVAADVAQFQTGGVGAFGEAALGTAMARAEQLAKGNKAEQAYSAAQQEFEQRQADIERFKTGTEKLAKGVEEATQAFDKAVQAMRATEEEIHKAKEVHKVNVITAETIGRTKDQAEIEMAGGRYGPSTQKVLDEVRAMAGTASGQQMSHQDTSYFNNLFAAARAQGKEAVMQGVIKELRDIHTDELKKWQDLWAAIQDLRTQHRDFRTQHRDTYNQ
jgi:hypothetical protein